MKKLVKLFSWLFAAGSFVLIAAILYVYAVLVPGLPSIDHLEGMQLQVPLRVYDRNEVLLAEFGEHRRIPVKFEKIPRHVIDAFIAAEDDQFWVHSGIDPLALMAAVYELVSTGKKTRGGSTITMQVARNFFLSAEKTYTRKVKEILLALKIEGELDKETILELYLNKIYLGNRAYGISAASQVYYDKPLDQLSIAQAAMVAGLPKAPSKYNPIRNPGRSLQRRNHILNRMHDLKYIDDEAYDLARTEPVTAELHVVRTIADARYVTEMVRAKLFGQFGEDVYKVGLKAYTSIDGKLQVAANRAVRKALLDYSRRHGYYGAIGNVDLTRVDGDPFDEDLVSDQRLGGLRKGVVISVNEAIQSKQGDGDAVGTSAAFATVLIADYQQIKLPFKKGIDWAAPHIDTRKQGKKPTRVGDVLRVGDVIWLEHRGDDWLLADLPRVEGAMVSIDPNDGGVRALVGGFDYFKSKFNRALQARRQPGSNFKPFIYSAALEKGFTAATTINDAPVVFDDDSLESTWRPENYSGKVYGPTRLREALVKSRNLVSIRILQAIGLRFATRYVERFGFDHDYLPYDLSLALGSGTFSPYQMVRAYSVFANGGYLIDPHIIDRVESGSGEVLFENHARTICQGCESDNLAEVAKSELADKAAQQATPGDQPEKQPTAALSAAATLPKPAPSDNQPATKYAPRVIGARNAYLMRSMMREVIQRGTGVRAKALGRKDIAGKTGTTNDQVDAWFSGFNNQVVTTAWVGFDNQRPLGSWETGSHAALPIWVDYMKMALDGMPENLEEEPSGLVTVRIDAKTGKRADAHTRHSRFETFRIENAPKEKIIAKSSPVDTAGNNVREPETEEEIVEDIF